MHYCSSSGLSKDGLLKKTRVELNLLRDQDINLLIERGMRGGMIRPKQLPARSRVKGNNQRALMSQLIHALGHEMTEVFLVYYSV